MSDNKITPEEYKAIQAAAANIEKAGVVEPSKAGVQCDTVKKGESQ